MKGSEVKKALESAAEKLVPNDPEKYPGFGLQVREDVSCMNYNDNCGDKSKQYHNTISNIFNK